MTTVMEGVVVCEVARKWKGEGEVTVDWAEMQWGRSCQVADVSVSMPLQVALEVCEAVTVATWCVRHVWVRWQKLGGGGGGGGVMCVMLTANPIGPMGLVNCPLFGNMIERL